MSTNDSIIKKIWNVIYPVIVHVVVYALIIFGGSLIISNMHHDTESYNRALIESSAVLSAIASAITIVILAIFFKRDNVVQSKQVIKKPGYLAAIIVLGITLCHGLSLLISLVADNRLVGEYETIQGNIFDAGPVLVVLITVILAPVCEELIFRGLMFRRLKNYTSFWVAAVVSSLIFGIYHLNLVQGVYAFIFGMVLCFVYEKADHVLAPMILHAAGNLASIILTYTGISYESPAVYYAVMIVFLLAAIAICYFVIKKIDHKRPA